MSEPASETIYYFPSGAAGPQGTLVFLGLTHDLAYNYSYSNPRAF